MSELNDLKNALLSSQDEVNVEVPVEGYEKKDWAEIFFEPQPAAGAGNNYVVKFIPNPGHSDIVFRNVYKLPDPDRRGKKFRYYAPDKDCPVLNLFFDLHDLKKQGDVIAEAKIKDYLGRTQQGCARVQILKSPNTEDIGKIKLFVFSTAKVATSHIWNLIQGKISPDQKLIDDGLATKENIFNIFSSTTLVINCKKGMFEGTEGRDYSASQWLNEKKKGAVVILDGKPREFTPADLVNGQLTTEATPYFEKFMEIISDPKLDTYQQFERKIAGDPRNTPDIEEYIAKTEEKVRVIVDVIRDGQLTEIANYGKPVARENGNQGADLLKDSIPDELQGTVMSNAPATAPANAPATAPANAPATAPATAPAVNQDSDPFSGLI